MPVYDKTEMNICSLREAINVFCIFNLIQFRESLIVAFSDVCMLIKPQW